jgi:hypothetical protein
MPCGAACPARASGDGDWFDPSSGTWNSLPEKYSGGFGPAVWTGSAMVVFATTAGASPPYGPRHVPPITNASLAWTGRQLIVVTMDDESGGTPQAEVLSSLVRDNQ